MPGHMGRNLAVAMFIVFLAEGCTGGGKPASSSAGNVGKAFLAKSKASNLSAHFTITGTEKAAGQFVSFTGEGEFHGSDYDLTESSQSAGNEGTKEFSYATPGGGYSRFCDGPWLQDSMVGPGDPLLRVTDRLSTVDDLGRETVNGKSLIHLRPPVSFTLQPADVGVLDSTASGFVGKVDFFVRGDGAPVALRESATWTFTHGGQSYSETKQEELDFSDLGVPVSVTAPAGSWTPFASKRFRYSIAYPSEWHRLLHHDGDEFTGPTECGLTARVLITRADQHPFTSNDEAASQEIAANRPDFGRPESNEGDDSGFSVLTYHVKGHSGQTQYILEGILDLARGTHQGTVGGIPVTIAEPDDEWRVVWVSKAGSEARDRSLFEQFLAKFQAAS